MLIASTREITGGSKRKYPVRLRAAQLEPFNDNGSIRQDEYSKKRAFLRRSHPVMAQEVAAIAAKWLFTAISNEDNSSTYCDFLCSSFLGSVFPIHREQEFCFHTVCRFEKIFQRRREFLFDEKQKSISSSLDARRHAKEIDRSMRTIFSSRLRAVQMTVIKYFQMRKNISSRAIYFQNNRLDRTLMAIFRRSIGIRDGAIRRRRAFQSHGHRAQAASETHAPCHIREQMPSDDPCS
jgi:hypothetical protein